MKINELEERQSPAEEEVEVEVVDATDDVDNLTEALNLLEDCYALLDALSDQTMNPQGRITRYFQRELIKQKEEVANLLMQYNLHEEEVE